MTTRGTWHGYRTHTDPKGVRIIESPGRYEGEALCLVPLAEAMEGDTSWVTEEAQTGEGSYSLFHSAGTDGLLGYVIEASRQGFGPGDKTFSPTEEERTWLANIQGGMGLHVGSQGFRSFTTHETPADFAQAVREAQEEAQTSEDHDDG